MHRGAPGSRSGPAASSAVLGWLAFLGGRGSGQTGARPHRAQGRGPGRRVPGASQAAVGKELTGRGDWSVGWGAGVSTSTEKASVTGDRAVGAEAGPALAPRWLSTVRVIRRGGGLWAPQLPARQTPRPPHDIPGCLRGKPRTWALGGRHLTNLLPARQGPLGAWPTVSRGSWCPQGAIGHF